MASQNIFFSESSPNIGGQELELLRQAQGLQAAGWKPRILCRPGSRIAEEAARRGLRVELVRFRNALDLASLQRVCALLRKHRPLAVICHSGHDATVCSLAVRLAAGLGLVPSRPRLVRMRTYQPGVASAFGYNHLFDITFTPSEAMRAQLLGNPKIRPERIEVLYPGIDFAQLERAAEAPLPPAVAQRIAEAGGPLIVHAAMLRPEKGHAFMLRLLPALLVRFPKLLYVAAGEGELLVPLQEQARALGLSRHVCFTGMLQPVAPLIRRADVLVMPSQYEPLGMSQIEALALGVPVVVSNVGGLPETVRAGETGLICPPPDQPEAPAAWAAALTRKLSDPVTARAMARRGREQVLVQFDPLANLAALMQACR
jgi:glycosyltransferase involved in cell wall biosynthesis